MTESVPFLAHRNCSCVHAEAVREGGTGSAALVLPVTGNVSVCDLGASHLRLHSCSSSRWLALHRLNGLHAFDWQVSYAIGVAQPLSVHVDSYGTGKIPDKAILAKVLDKFDFRPGEPSHHS